MIVTLKFKMQLDHREKYLQFLVQHTKIHIEI